ncbi:unnamed protein product, partial [Arabidopsis halleri]
WCSKTVHHFLSNQLAIESGYEIWSLIEGYPLRFSLHEFSDITGLNCDEIDEKDKVDVDHSEFWAELEVDASKGPNWKELNAALKKCRGWSYEKRKMLGMLFVLNVGILGKSRSSRIPLEYAKRVFDSEAFERYPWGRVGFKSLIKSIKVVSYENGGYVVHGCVHALLIWAFESVSALGQKYGNHIEGDNVPLLSWKGGRPRCCIGDFLATEKKLHKKLDVQHMVVQSEEDLYPNWPDEKAVYGEGVGAWELLDNLMHDIMLGRVDGKFWEEVPGKKKGKRKAVVEETQDDFVDPPPKKQKQQSEKRSKGGDSVFGGGSVGEVLNMMTALVGKMDTMQSKIDGRFDGLTDTVGGIEKKVIDLEKEVQMLKTSRNEKKGDEEGSVNKMKETSQEGFPISCVVRKPSHVSKAKAGLNTSLRREDIFQSKSVNASVKELFSAAATNCKSGLQKSVTPISTGPHSSVKKKGIKTEPIDPVDSVSPVCKTKTTPGVDIAELSEGSDSSENKRNKALNGALDDLLRLCKKDDFVSRVPRQKNLASTQVHPFIGSSLVKRILRGKKLSPTVYDPFEKATQLSVDMLVAFIRHDLDNPLETTNGAANFYLRIMTPKEEWPVGDECYGWLKDAHLCPAMQLLRKRSMQPVTPFITDRLAFLDSWFVNQWAHDYKKWDSDKKWLFPEEYFKVYSGLSPSFGITNKKWVEDVDFVYLAHNINNNHWIALEVDLQRRRIKAYDSILTAYTDEEVYESCKPYTRMIPALLQTMAPPGKKKTLGAAAFSFYRVKSAPQNIQEGDCGIYSFKYIECLALGLTFEGLSDAAMPWLRMKLASDILTEVPGIDCFIQMSDPNPRHAESGGVQFISETK